jgi:RNA polymerase sigma-70 factor (ECF subfamily)
LLSRAVDRLHQLCASLLYRSYPRLTRGPLNLQTEEMLSAVVERLIKAMRQVRPATVRQFFALCNQHMRWELNDLARRLDSEVVATGLRESFALAPTPQSTTPDGPKLARILQAIEALPDEEREVFNLVQIQGMTQREAADVVDVSAKTIQRRLHRSLILLNAALSDLQPPDSPPPLA